MAPRLITGRHLHYQRSASCHSHAPMTSPSPRRFRHRLRPTRDAPFVHAGERLTDKWMFATR